MVATPEVVKHIAATKAAKLAYWGPQMKDGAPTQVYVPQALEANSFTIDGEKVTIMQPHDYAAFVGSGEQNDPRRHRRGVGYASLDRRHPDAGQSSAMA